MLQPNTPPMEVVTMIADVAVLKKQVEHLTAMLEKQNAVLERQDRVLEELVALANKGKGSLWMFIALGGIIGAAVTNFKSLIQVLVR